MPRYYCDYCDTYLTHDSPSVRKQHNAGYKHKANVRTYYQQFEEQQTQLLIDQKVREHLGHTVVLIQGTTAIQQTITVPSTTTTTILRPVTSLPLHPNSAALRPSVRPWPMTGSVPPGQATRPMMSNDVQPGTHNRPAGFVGFANTGSGAAPGQMVRPPQSNVPGLGPNYAYARPAGAPVSIGQMNQNGPGSSPGGARPMFFSPGQARPGQPGQPGLPGQSGQSPILSQGPRG